MNCDLCLWRTEGLRDDQYFCCHTVYFNSCIKKNEKGEWARQIKGKMYKIGQCKGFVLNSSKNQRKYLSIVLDIPNNKDSKI